MARKKLKAVEAVDIYVKDIFDDYIDYKLTFGRSEKTIESIRNSFKKFFGYFGDDITIGSIDTGLIYQYTNHLKKLELTTSSINHYLRDLRTFVYWCYEQGHLEHKIEVKMIKGQEAVKETYEDEELIRLLAKPKKTDGFTEWRDWAIVNWIYGTGNRISTVVEVRVEDINIKKNDIVIRAQKNKKAASIPMDKRLAAVLREYMQRCRPEAKEEDFLFTNIYGEQLSTNALQQSIRRYNERREVTKTSPHALRHTFAKNWVMNGGDIFRLQKILGHSTLEMTRHYVNLYGADLKEGFDEISPLSKISKVKGGSKKGKLKVQI